MRPLTTGISTVRALAKRVPGVQPLAGLLRMATDSALREERRLVRDRADDLFQQGGRSAIDRYPDLFAALRDQLHDHPAPHILSFGCSTGEELQTLRHYLPKARLSGLDINRARLRRARRGLADPGVSLVAAHSIEAAGGGNFDAIVCLSVLHRRELVHDWPADPTPHLSFAQFERAVLDFDRHLATRGLLLLYHTVFRFLETSVAPRYEPLFLVDPLSLEPSRRYDRNDRRVLEPREERFALFRKTS